MSSSPRTYPPRARQVMAACPGARTAAIRLAALSPQAKPHAVSTAGLGQCLLISWTRVSVRGQDTFINTGMHSRGAQISVARCIEQKYLRPDRSGQPQARLTSTAPLPPCWPGAHCTAHPSTGQRVTGAGRRQQGGGVEPLNRGCRQGEGPD